MKKKDRVICHPHYKTVWVESDLHLKLKIESTLRGVPMAQLVSDLVRAALPAGGASGGDG